MARGHDLPMTAIERSLDRATQRARQDLATLGRGNPGRPGINHDISQRAAAERLGASPATWSRLERGLTPNASLLRVARALAIVGLDLHVRAYPGGDAMRDTPQRRLLARFEAELGPGARWSTEVGLPNAGDRRGPAACMSASISCTGCKLTPHQAASRSRSCI